METRRCMNCMAELERADMRYCSACGFDMQSVEQLTYTLKCNSILHGKYLIGRVLGQGGFGITYVGLDLALNIKVAVKEYFPMGLVTRDSGNSTTLLWNPTQVSQSQRQIGYDSFLKEARKMAKVDQISSIVRVRDTFLENETAYIIMDFVEGSTLKEKLLKEGPMTFSQCMALLQPLMEGLASIHKQGMIHRDISPDNIMIQPDGSVRLLDLGAAKDMTAVGDPKSQLVAKKGFSPLEQYVENGKIGPWTDVYALCATIFYSITGKMLPDALQRLDHEELQFPTGMKEPLSDQVCDALRTGLAVKPENRIQTIEELLQKIRTNVREQEMESVTVPISRVVIQPQPDVSSQSDRQPQPEAKPKKKRRILKWAGIVIGSIVLLFFIGLFSSDDNSDNRRVVVNSSTPQVTENAQGNSSAGSVTQEPQAAEKKYANVVELIKSGETQNELQPLMKNSLPVGRGLTATSSGNKFIYIRFVEDGITQMSDEDLAEDVLVCQEIAEVLPDIVTDVPAVVELSCKRKDESVVYTRQFEVKN